jgi:carboxyl-terminal processing protease
MRKSRLLVVGIAAITLITAPLAVAIGAKNSGGRISGLSANDLALLGGIIQLVQRDYVHPVGSEELTKDALKGMLSRLDPHSDYMDEQEFQETQSDLSGRFGGLGIQISQQDGLTKVISPIEGTPAAKVGVQPGDLIVGINGESTQGVNLTKIVRQLRGTPGTRVTITLLRGTEKPFDVTITRKIIQVESVKSKLESDKVGYVRITEFGEKTPEDFKKAVEGIKKKAGGSLNGLVLDLRNDPGGLLTSAIAVAGHFLDGGKVVSIRGRRKSSDQSFDAPSGGMLLPKQTPIVVLINGASASASEIVAGALQDRNRATVMGTQSFGKGSVQTVIPLYGHGALRLTTALYYTPNGRSIQGKGITPGIVVEAAKNEQISGGMLVRENTLHGAFANPGTLGKPAAKSGTEPVNENEGSKPDLSPPIKFDLIGTENDTQLKAALNYIQKNVSTTNGEAAGR